MKMQDMPPINKRRLWLIGKRLNLELTAAEKRELAELDAEAAPE